MQRKNKKQINISDRKNELHELFRKLYDILEFGEKHNFCDYVNTFLTPARAQITIFKYCNNFNAITPRTRKFFENLLVTCIIQYTKEYADRKHQYINSEIDLVETKFKEYNESKCSNNKAGQSSPVE